ncbi:uncharacterized protein LOC130980852 [Arachis stenosperma]|uniref:uncharacterized protein LOC130980852 n=1 Tax=Arachis stenosperma TaxID=217475 RepID=UPI0025AD7B9E|nr:uncharacterized protein LOC130980852 [Arachis stenosperma]
MVGRDGDRSRGHGRGRGRGQGRKGRPRLSTGQPLDLHTDPYSLVGSSSDTTALTNGRPPPVATTTPSRQEPQIQMMPTPGVPISCTQQANEPSNTASHGVQSNPAIGQGTSTATGHSSTSAPKLRYDGAKCWHPHKPGLKRISQVFRKNYNKPWLSFDEADDDTRKIWWTKWRKCFDIINTEEDNIYQAWRFRAAKRLRGMLHAIRKKGARPYWIPPEVLGELMRRWNTDAYRQLQTRNTAARKSTQGTSLHTTGGTTFPEARLRLHTHTRKEDRTQWVDEHSRKTKDIFQERMFQAEQERQAAIEAGVTDPPPVSEDSIWIETVGEKRRGRVYGMGEVRDSSMVRPRVDGSTTTTSADVLDLRERIIILNREVEQHAAKYRELEDRYQREKREWQQTIESLREDLNTSNSQMDQFSHQLSSLTEYVRAMGPSSSRHVFSHLLLLLSQALRKAQPESQSQPQPQVENSHLFCSDQDNHRVLKGRMILTILMTQMII